MRPATLPSSEQSILQTFTVRPVSQCLLKLNESLNLPRLPDCPKKCILN